MATYDELRTAEEDPVFTRRVRTACLVAADIIRLEATSVGNHANRLLWAKGVYKDPDSAAPGMIREVLAANRSATLAQIIGASDATIQTAVNAAVDIFATGTA